MNVDPNNTDLNSHICFDALATLQSIKNVDNCKYFFDNYVAFIRLKHTRAHTEQDIYWTTCASVKIIVENI